MAWFGVEFLFIFLKKLQHFLKVSDVTSMAHGIQRRLNLSVEVVQKPVLTFQVCTMCAGVTAVKEDYLQTRTDWEA